ncbi:MAG: LptF/LptG family permease [Desulfomonile tiedjei]|nr:LptF/LptG family permease [Desulfomonile tiedjei]
MRLTIIDRYVFREIAAAFAFTFAVFLSAGLIVGFVPLLQKGMEKGLELTLILFQMLVSALPGTLVTVLPLSMMIAVLLGLGRMAADNEIAAIKSSGISVLRLFPSVAVMGLVGCALSLLCTLILIPRGIAEGRRLVQEATTAGADAGIEERTFFDRLSNLILYVESIDHATGVLSRVFIRESSDPDEVRTILAQKGKLTPDPERKALILDLRKGTILKEDRGGDSSGTLAFEGYVFRWPLEQAGSKPSPPSFEELSIAGIRQRIKAIDDAGLVDTPETQGYYRRVHVFARMLICQRFVHPLACLALAFAAFPLGVLYLGKSRLNNVALGLVAIFIYYALTLTTERMARSEIAPPELILPLPPLLFMVVGAYLSRCVDRERTPRVVGIIRKLSARR